MQNIDPHIPDISHMLPADKLVQASVESVEGNNLQMEKDLKVLVVNGVY